jgi:hypothetical protein
LAVSARFSGGGVSKSGAPSYRPGSELGVGRVSAGSGGGADRRWARGAPGVGGGSDARTARDRALGAAVSPTGGGAVLCFATVGCALGFAAAGSAALGFAEASCAPTGFAAGADAEPAAGADCESRFARSALPGGGGGSDLRAGRAAAGLPSARGGGVRCTGAALGGGAGALVVSTASSSSVGNSSSSDSIRLAGVPDPVRAAFEGGSSLLDRFQPSAMSSMRLSVASPMRGRRSERPSSDMAGTNYHSHI